MAKTYSYRFVTSLGCFYGVSLCFPSILSIINVNRLLIKILLIYHRNTLAL